MKNSRRHFLYSLGGGAATAATSISSLCMPSPVSAASAAYSRVSGSRIRIGLAAYSFRGAFRYMRGKEVTPQEGQPEMDMLSFIDFCARHGVDGAELTSYFFPPDVDQDYLGRCRRQAHVNGVAISGTAVGNNFSYPKESPERAKQMAYVREWVDHASVMGAPHIRVFAGKHPKGVSAEEAEQNAVEALQEAAEYAGAKGIFLGIENHDSIGSAELLLRIVQAVDSPWVGVNLDTGNFRTDDPYADMKESAPFAVNVQLKTKLKVEGEVVDTDLQRVADLLAAESYSGYVTLEFEEKENPFEKVPAVLDKMRAAFVG